MVRFVCFLKLWKLIKGGIMKIKLSKSQWQNIGRKAGWIKISQVDSNSQGDQSGLMDSGVVVPENQPPDQLGMTEDPSNIEGLSEEQRYQVRDLLSLDQVDLKLSPEERQMMGSIRGQLNKILPMGQWQQDPKAKSAIYNFFSTIDPSKIPMLKQIINKVQGK
jgi:hypothetical protein